VQNRRFVIRTFKGKYQQPYAEFNIPFDFEIVIKAAKEDLRPTIPPNCPPMLSSLVSQLLQLSKSKRPTLEQLLEKLTLIEDDFNTNNQKWTLSH